MISVVVKALAFPLKPRGVPCRVLEIFLAICKLRNYLLQKRQE
jgi:hypothetical protein